MNLDADSALERFVATSDVSSDHSSEIASVRIVDRCRGGDVQYRPVRDGKRMSMADVRGPAALGRRAVLFSLGYGGRTAVGVVVRLRANPPACASVERLFSYSTSRPPVAPPRGMFARAFNVVPRDVSRRYAGRELVLTEHYGRNSGDELARRVTYFRFNSGRYVSYRTRLIR
jgi:hypothetical protein